MELPRFTGQSAWLITGITPLEESVKFRGQTAVGLFGRTSRHESALHRTPLPFSYANNYRSFPAKSPATG